MYPISSNRLNNKSYPQQKASVIIVGVIRHLFDVDSDEAADENVLMKAKFCDGIMEQLRDKIHDSETSRDEKFKLLSVLPKSWMN